MSAQQNVVHIGFPKTGTTTLQETFFNNHPQINYLGSPYKSQEMLVAMEVKLTKNILSYNNNSEIIKNIFLNELSKNSDKKKNINLLSYEGLSFQPSKTPDRATIAKRIKEVFGADTKIIITIRNQRNFCLSHYGQDVRNGTYLNLTNYIKYLLDYYESYSYLSLLDYLPLIKYYEELFKKENVLVLCYEDLSSNPNIFFSRISSFLNIDKIKYTKRFNKSLGSLSLFLQRIFNRIITFDNGRPLYAHGVRLPGKVGHSLRGSYKYLIYRIISFLDPILPFNKKIKFPEKHLKNFDQIFGDNNKKISENYKLKLKDYDYPGL